jgi:hypothetical protein
VRIRTDWVAAAEGAPDVAGIAALRGSEAHSTHDATRAAARADSARARGGEGGGGRERGGIVKNGVRQEWVPRRGGAARTRLAVLAEDDDGVLRTAPQLRRDLPLLLQPAARQLVLRPPPGVTPGGQPGRPCGRG